MKRWWEEWPDRLEYELKALEDAGIPCKRNERAFEEGRFELELSPIFNGEKVELIAKFPDLYPYFRFEVIAPNLSLPHHQNPFGKNLCLIGRATENWSVCDTLANFITERLPDVIRAGKADINEDLSGTEIPQGEPFTDYYEYVQGAIVVDSAWNIGAAKRTGKLLIGLRLIGQRIIGAVHEIRGQEGELLAAANVAIRRLFPVPIEAHWVRLGSPVPYGRGPDFASHIFQHYPNLREGRWTDAGNHRFKVIGVIFPEEVEYRNERDGWTFLICIRSPRNQRQMEPKYHLVRAARCGREDLTPRVPELKTLAQKKIVVFGLGCVGAPSSIEFARAGIGELRLVDGDFVEAGTVVRWPLGVTSVGAPKVEAIRDFVESQYPYTTVKCYMHQLGAVLGKRTSDLEILDDVLADADLIYDATAEVGVQYFLSELARKRAIPYVMAWATNGGWGAVLARFVPGQTEGCWSCLEFARKQKIIPSPPERPGDWVQPLGCAAPTFTGAAFDIAQVSMQGVRLAAAILSRDTEGGYPDFDWDVGILSLRSADGAPIPPKWETFRLSRHPACQLCKDSH